MNSAPRGMRFDFLDALRGIAILMVMILHFAERGKEAGDHLIHEHVWPVLSHGYLGVQLFFVISGYCISAAVYAGLAKRQSVAEFLRRRARRIFPPYWASILLVVILGWATIAILKTPRSTVFPLAPWEWLANAALLQGPLAARDANLVYWSLSIEIQFYVVMAVGLLLGAAGIEAWLVAVSAIALWMHWTHWPLTGWILNYWLEFSCGIAGFYWITGRHRFRLTPWILLLLVFVGVGMSAQDHPSWFLADGKFILAARLLFCVASMGVLLLAYPHDVAFMQHRWVKILSPVGLISYSLYLTHVPVATRVFNLGERLTGLHGLRWLIYFVVALVVTLTFGWIFHCYGERPWLNAPTPSDPSPARSKAK